MPKAIRAVIPNVRKRGRRSGLRMSAEVYLVHLEGTAPFSQLMDLIVSNHAPRGWLSRLCTCMPLVPRILSRV